MNKSYKGIRSYVDDFNHNVFDVVIIKWNEHSQWYDIETYDGVFSIEISSFSQDIFGQWAVTLTAAKRKALMDTGLKSSDFKWEEI